MRFHILGIAWAIRCDSAHLGCFDRKFNMLNICYPSLKQFSALQWGFDISSHIIDMCLTIVSSLFQIAIAAIQIHHG